MGRYEIRRVAGEATLADAHAVRRAVFVEEQGVPEDLELDGLDGRASQFVAYELPAERPVGTARLRTPRDEKGKPERVAVRRSHRGEGLGKRLMAAVETAARDQGCERLVLHAQTTVEAFYEQLGYETTSDIFEEAGIPHVRMEKEL
jgi:predicted GNAT family N-acyltransferase